MDEVTIKTEQDGQLALVELNRPDRRNSLSLEMIKQLTDVFRRFAGETKARAVILSGKGPVFCAGADLSWMALKPEASDFENAGEARQLFQMFQAIASCPLPVIGKIQGAVFGGGLGLVSVCDIAAADEKSTFCFSELKLGLIPSVISPFVLERMPHSKAKELMLSARVFGAEEALAAGLIHFSGNFSGREEYIKSLSSGLLTRDKTALKQLKQLLAAIPQMPFKEAGDYCVQALAERRKSPDVLKNISRFLKARKK